MNHRYETKFVLDEVQLRHAENWIELFARFKERYSKRFVNSIYFDSTDFESLADNISGIAVRKKLRYRWYGENFANNSGVTIEVKGRDGAVGYKQGFSRELVLGRGHSLVADISKDLLSAVDRIPRLAAFAAYQPVLGVQYSRRYYESDDGIRLTVDSCLKFHDIFSFGEISYSTPYQSPINILEVKYPIAQRARAGLLLKDFPFKPVRSSKYVLGSALAGRVVYI